MLIWGKLPTCNFLRMIGVLSPLRLRFKVEGWGLLFRIKIYRDLIRAIAPLQ